MYSPTHAFPVHFRVDGRKNGGLTFSLLEVETGQQGFFLPGHSSKRKSFAAGPTHTHLMIIRQRFAQAEKNKSDLEKKREKILC